MVMAVANARAAPTTGTIGIRFQETSGTHWPVNSDATFAGHFANPRDAWRSFFLARVLTLPATPQTFELQADGDGGADSQVRYTRILAFRTDAFPLVESTQNLAEQSSGSSTPVVTSTLYQIDVNTPLPTKRVQLGDGTGAVGSPSMDLKFSMIYVGTDAGIIYGIRFPLP